MKFATLKNGTPDGQLVLVSEDGQSAVAVPDLASSLLDAIQRWANDDLRSLNAQIEFLLRRAAQQAGRLKEQKVRPAKS